MASLILQTSIDIDRYSSFRFVKLKKGQFIVFSNSSAFLFNKNLSFKCLDIETYLNNIKSVKQIKNGKILICSNDLYIFTIESKEIKKDHIKMLDKNSEKILDVNELQDGTIIGISNKSIYNITIKDEKTEITQIYKIPNVWLVSWEKKK